MLKRHHSQHQARFPQKDTWAHTPMGFLSSNNRGARMLGYSVREDNQAGTGLHIKRRVRFIYLNYMVVFLCKSERMISEEQDLRKTSVHSI